MKRHLLIFLLFCMCLTVSSQGLKIQGRVTDEHGDVIEVFDAMILRADSSVIAASVFTDGSFNINIPDNNAAFLKIRSMGYKQAFIDIPKTFSDSIANIGDIRLPAESKILKEVVVEAQRPLIRLTGDTYTVDVQNTYLKSVGTFIDVLRRVPGIEVSGKGGISVIGKPRLLININGRYVRSYAELTALQSHQIKSISIDRNPSAAYSSSYDAVINITTVDAIQDYMQFVVTDDASVSRRFSNNAGVSFNFKLKKIFSFSNIQYGDNSLKQYDTEDKTVWTESQELQTHRFNRLKHNSRSFRFNQIFEYQLRPYAILGIGYNLSVANQNSNKTQDFSATSVDQSMSVMTLSDTRQHKVGHNPTLYFVYRNNKRSLSVFTDYYRATSDNTQNIAENSVSKSPYLFSDNYSVGGIKADYSQKLDFLSYDAGGKFSYIKDKGKYTSGDAEMQNSSQESLSYDAYLNFSKSIKSFTFKAGLRFESEHVKSANNSIMALDTTYINLFPYLSVSYNAKRARGALTYSRRIYKPSYGQLIMKNVYIDPLSYSIGNPLLKSTLVDIISFSFQKGMFTGMLSYMYNHNKKAQIALLEKQDGAEKVKFTYDNIPNQHTLQLYMVYYRTFGKIRGSSTLMLTSSSMKYNGTKYVSLKDIGVYAKANIESPLWKEATLMLSVSYQNAQHNDFYFMKPTFNSSLYFSQNLFGKKVRLTIGAEDIFKTVKGNSWTQNMQYAKIRMATDGDTRSLSISVRYMFGRNKDKSHSKSSIQEEKSRL